MSWRSTESDGGPRFGSAAARAREVALTSTSVVDMVRRRASIGDGAGEHAATITGVVVTDDDLRFWVTREANVMYRHCVVPWLADHEVRTALDHAIRSGAMTATPPLWGAPRRGVDRYLLVGDAIGLPLIRVAPQEWCVVTVAVRRSSPEVIARRRGFRVSRRRRGTPVQTHRAPRNRWVASLEEW